MGQAPAAAMQSAAGPAKEDTKPPHPCIKSPLKLLLVETSESARVKTESFRNEKALDRYLDERRRRRDACGLSEPSDLAPNARIIMGDDEAALLRLWREKRGEIEPENLSGNLIVQLGGGDRRPQSALVRTTPPPLYAAPLSSMPSILQHQHWLSGREPHRALRAESLFSILIVVPALAAFIDRCSADSGCNRVKSFSRSEAIPQNCCQSPKNRPLVRTAKRPPLSLGRRRSYFRRLLMAYFNLHQTGAPIITETGAKI